MNGTVLIVDDEESIRTVLQALLKPLDCRVLTAASAEEALEVLSEEWCDLILSDIRMEGMDGLEFLRRARAEWPRVRVILMSAHGTMDDVVQALRLGAVDFWSKPLAHKELRGQVARWLSESLAENKANLESTTDRDGIVGQSPSLLKAVDLARRAAAGEANVLIRGESGTGKEVFARWIHAGSPRESGPFVALNCGAIPENLVESELFGHEKGSFSGAYQTKMGKFELADGGTLFLDEIGELPLLAQVKLLRALQERVVQRVGGTTERKVDFRLIAATHRDLARMAADGRFREDLYYRLNVIPVELPPLRERGEDVVLLAQFVLNKLNVRYGTQWQLDREHQKQLSQHPWPGNVRELENVLERSVVLSSGARLELLLETLQSSVPSAVKEQDTGVKLSDARAKSEREAILEVLEQCRWNKTKTAESLGISRRGLLYKLKDYGIS